MFRALVITFVSVIVKMTNDCSCLSVTVPLIYAEAVVGTTADLTCDLRSSVPGDYVLLVLWYKDGDTIPFYR